MYSVHTIRSALTGKEYTFHDDASLQLAIEQVQRDDAEFLKTEGNHENHE